MDKHYIGTKYYKYEAIEKINSLKRDLSKLSLNSFINFFLLKFFSIFQTIWHEISEHNVVNKLMNSDNGYFISWHQLHQ